MNFLIYGLVVFLTASGIALWSGIGLLAVVCVQARDAFEYDDLGGEDCC